MCKTIKSIAILLPCIMLMACAAMTEHEPLPKISNAADVQKCRNLGNVDGESGYGKNTDWKDLAKHSALIRAKELGASHIVLGEYVTEDNEDGSVYAIAYLCK
ncbi:MAG: hypothetical protein ACXWAT_01585 [Methylobacter sp.]